MYLPPDHPRWTEIDALFQAALEHEPDQRRAFVLHTCKDDVLRDAVLGLLGASEEASGFLEGPASLTVESSPLAGLASDLLDEIGPSGQRVGPYRIVQPLARGGMGTVYLAERADGQFEKRVALKVLRRGLDTEDVLGRFRAERQILASLTHPHIARLLDGGETTDGRPYLVMEYVEGRPVDRYADEERLTLDERLRLFHSIGAAVESAHRSLVIHRDLKPSNILVRDDGDVKLLDFGIAKLLDDPGVPSPAPRTRTGVWMLTPEYASPEQVRGDPITTASDVYQLGLLLYQLLSGSRAYGVQGRSPAEVEREVCTQVPTLMSARIERRGEDATAAAEVARARSTTPDRLRRRLRGDLDAIVAKALRKNPEGRYASVRELLEDLERAANDQPVAAHKGSRRYRVRKFVTRNRLPVASAAVISFLLVGLVGVSLRYASATAEHARLVAAERDRAHAEAQKADRVASLLAGLFQRASPDEALGREITVHEALKRGLPAVEAELADEHETRASLLGTIGKVYQSLGEDELAESALRKALVAWQQDGGGDHEDHAAALNGLSFLLAADARYEEAETRARESLAMYRRLFGSRHEGTASALENLAFVHMQRGESEEALPLLREALGTLREVLDDDDPQVATALSNLGVTLSGLQQVDSAELVLREAVSIRERVLSANHPQLAVSLRNLGSILRHQGRYEEAEPMLRRALAIDREVHGPEHRRIAIDLLTLGYLLRDTGRFTEAEPLLREAVSIARERSEEPVILNQAMNMLGVNMSDQGRFAESERLHREVLERRRALHGSNDPRVGVSLYNLARARLGQEQYAEAAEALREVVAIDSAAYGAQHPEVGVDLTNLAAALAGAGRLEEADQTYRRALHILRAALPADHPRIANAVLGRGELLLDRDAPAEAVPLLREGLEIRTQTLGAESGLTAVAASLLGAALTAEGTYEEGLTLLERGYAGTRNAWGAEDRRAQAALERLAAARHEIPHR